MFTEPLNCADLEELAKHVYFRSFKQGETIENEHFHDREEIPEIYIILKGKVRLGFPLESCEAAGQITEHLRRA
jgi:hypothetical protein